MSLPPSMNADELIQYVIVFDSPRFPSQHVVYAKVGETHAIRPVAVHRDIEAVRLAIPTTHVRANFKQTAPIVEIWVDRRIADPFGGDGFVHV